MDSPKLQLADKLKTANNILVTVSRNPSVDQLAACIGLTILLNKQGKHAAAVFSGAVPSTLEFLQPEDTLEKNTDSLRDFIIALDKSKADKLRYKVEDNVVRIFITPYKTSISQDDLEFSQGDFNVDVVVALGVNEQSDLDEAITAHGRILHDATVTTITVSTPSELGAINWNDPTASSLSELVTDLTQIIGKDLLDGQIATALLTGIVAETDRFSNEKTTPQTMSVSAQLMAAGANQQLVASKLDATSPIPEKTDDNGQADAEQPKSNDGTLEIQHGAGNADDNEAAPAEEAPKEEALPVFELPEPVEDNDEVVNENAPTVVEPNKPTLTSGSRLITEAPTLGGTLTANSRPEDLDPMTDPLSAQVQSGMLLDHNGAKPMNAPNLDELLSRNDTPNEPELPVLPEVPASSETPQIVTELPRKVLTPLEPAPPEVPDESTLPKLDDVAPASPAPTPPAEDPTPAPAKPEPLVTGLTPPPPAWVPPSQDPFNEAPHDDKPAGQTLSEIEASVKSQHLAADAHLVEARDQVLQALNSSATGAQEPIQALNAQPLGESLHPEDTAPVSDRPGPGFVAEQPLPQINITDDVPSLTPLDASAKEPQVFDPNAPPPVPPPIPFQFGGTPPAAQQ